MSERIDFAEFKQRASEFFRLLPSSNEQQANNGKKMLVLSYLNLEGSETEVFWASRLVIMAGNRLIERWG